MKPTNPGSKKVFLLVAIIILVVAIGIVGIRLLSLSYQKTEVPSVTPPPQEIVVAPTTYELEINLEEESVPSEETPIEEATTETQTQEQSPTPTETLLAEVEETETPTTLSPSSTVIASSPTQTQVQTTETTSAPESGIATYSIVFLSIATLLIIVAFVL